MKGKFFKLLLPAFAILMAVGLAFANENERVTQEAHYFLPGQGWQTVMIEDDCGPTGQLPCEFNGNQLYSEPDFASIPLRKP
ncbi:MAG: DUF6520 family protein [Allomuricauda sp.]|uniref:Secreted protein n=1 Tax=Flagellimonas oceani TaxID=2698672 RepID=A0A6G7J8S4_9FLAO|nr:MULTISPECIES: DUF6520 family protein [Allomuricauda]MBW8241914.1 hypothetical protein [Allomuricauda oceani]QII46827.1 hypothetical protein GVT53_19795 [Allomuricauda oceani]